LRNPAARNSPRTGKGYRAGGPARRRPHPRVRRVHALRAPRARIRELPHPLRGHRGHARRDGLFQSDPQGEHGERRDGHRQRVVAATSVRGGERRGGADERAAGGRSRDGLYPRPSAATGAGGRRGAAADREDVCGREELFPQGRRPHRLHSHAGHSPQLDRAARGIRAGRLQRAGTDAERAGRARHGKLHASRTGGVSADDRGTQNRAQGAQGCLFLRDPDSHAFDLYHDYTESRPGIDRYLNVVRKGSTASNPAARNLDTGETLRVETLKGDAVLASGPAQEEGVKPDDDVVVAHFAAVPAGGSVRLRISETYTDPKSYRLEGDDLVFDRTFGRPRNAVVLPAGWSLTATSIPAMVTETSDGRIRLDFLNNRPDEIAVLIKARRRGGA